MGFMDAIRNRNNAAPIVEDARGDAIRDQLAGVAKPNIPNIGIVDDLDEITDHEFVLKYGITKETYRRNNGDHDAQFRHGKIAKQFDEEIKQVEEGYHVIGKKNGKMWTSKPHLTHGSATKEHLRLSMVPEMTGLKVVNLGSLLEEVPLEETKRLDLTGRNIQYIGVRGGGLTGATSKKTTPGAFGHVISHDLQSGKVKIKTVHGVDTVPDHELELNEATVLVKQQQKPPRNYAVGDIVHPNVGPHKGESHKVIHVHGDGSMNIVPEVSHHAKNKYRLGAARCTDDQIDVETPPKKVAALAKRNAPKQTESEKNADKTGHVSVKDATGSFVGRYKSMDDAKKLKPGKGHTYHPHKITEEYELLAEQMDGPLPDRVEPINELSVNLLNRYTKRSVNDAHDNHGRKYMDRSKNDFETRQKAGDKMDSRLKSAGRAFDKVDKGDGFNRPQVKVAATNEEAEQIEELSSKTLGSYIGKAHVDHSDKTRVTNSFSDVLKHYGETGHKDKEDRKWALDGYVKNDTKRYNRDRGISLAAKKLAREDVEQLDEAQPSKHPSRSLMGKVRDNVSSDDMTKHGDGTVTFRRGYFYRHGETSDKWAGRVSDQLNKAGIKHTVLDHDDVNPYKAFKGGASVKSQSHFAARVKLHEDISEEQINEISKDLSSRYFDKAATSRGAAEKAGDKKTLAKREAGTDRAFKRITEGALASLAHGAAQHARSNKMNADDAEKHIGDTLMKVVNQHSGSDRTKLHNRVGDVTRSAMSKFNEEVTADSLLKEMSTNMLNRLASADNRKEEEPIEEGLSVGDVVHFTSKRAFKQESGKFRGKIIHDHGDGRYNINYTYDEATKRRHGGHQYPATVHKDNIEKINEEHVEEGFKVGDNVRATNPKATPRYRVVGKDATHYHLQDGTRGVKRLSKSRIHRVNLEGKRLSEEDQIEEGKAYVKPFGDNGFKSSDKHGHVKFWNEHGKASAHKHAGIALSENEAIEEAKKEMLVIKLRPNFKFSHTVRDHKGRLLDKDGNLAESETIDEMSAGKLEDYIASIGNKPDHPGVKRALKKLKKLEEEAVITEARRGRPPKVAVAGREEDEREHVLMQLRKNVSLAGLKKIKFSDGSQHSVSAGHSQRILSKYADLAPKHKEAFQSHIEKSHANLLAGHDWKAPVDDFSKPKVREVEGGGGRTIKKPLHRRSPQAKLDARLAMIRRIAAKHNNYAIKHK